MQGILSPPDDEEFVRICDELSDPSSPYNFDQIPISILGSIYERFLGKVVHASEKRAKVEEKPEVKKAGGVYYTPEYVVRYIVNETVGKLIERKTPEEIAKMAFADIACGSGSFLIEVFNQLLEYHAHYYFAHPDKRKETDVFERNGKLRLTLKKKKEILLNNIYGVDIDSQATEVTQLSLYLKLLEDVTMQDAYQFGMFKETILPDLRNNIVNGNSLIGRDILEEQLFAEIDESKLKPMNFEDAFPIILRRGGFNAVVGNPPWGASFSDEELEYLRNKFNDIIVRMIDSFMYFVRQSTLLMGKNGFFGMILPDVVLYQSDNQRLRDLITNNYQITSILNLGDVFDNVKRPSGVLVFQGKQKNNIVTKVADFRKLGKAEKALKIFDATHYKEVDISWLTKVTKGKFATDKLNEYLILERVFSTRHKLLKDLVDDDGIQRGVSPDLKEAFIVDSKTVKDYKLEKEQLRRVLTGGRQAKRYYFEDPNLSLIYTRREENWKKIPNICGYIDQFKSKITCREVKEKKHSIHSLHRAREEKIFLKGEKLLGVITEDEIVLCLDNEQMFTTDGLYVFSVKSPINIKYVMGVLNSKLFITTYRLLSFEEGRMLAQVKPTLLEQLPIRSINFDDPQDKSRHDAIVKLVEQMLETKQRLLISKTQAEASRQEMQCVALDRQIDEAVYELYDLTDAEIEIVEGEK